MRGALLAIFMIAASVPSSATSQQIGILQTPILTVDGERLLNDSAFGQRIAREFDRRRADLVAEGLIIQSELEEEERQLVEKRKTLPAEDFRKLADAFDAKVQKIRAEQDEKAQKLNVTGDDDQLSFLRAAQPIFEQIITEHGAVVILDQRNIFLRIDQVDITDEAIRRIDEAIGEGKPIVQPEDAPVKP